MQNDDIIDSIVHYTENLTVESLNDIIKDGGNFLLLADETLQKDFANKLARNVATAVSLEWAGQNAYIKKYSAFKEEQIYLEFTGNNIRELARKFHLAEMTIRRIVNTEHKKRTALKQGTLL